MRGLGAGGLLELFEDLDNPSLAFSAAHAMIEILSP